jgi:hypothetical protein
MDSELVEWVCLIIISCIAVASFAYATYGLLRAFVG